MLHDKSPNSEGQKQSGMLQFHPPRAGLPTILTTIKGKTYTTYYASATDIFHKNPWRGSIPPTLVFPVNAPLFFSVGGGFKHLLFSPLLGEMIQIDG